MKDKIKTKKEIRQEAEKEAAKAESKKAGGAARSTPKVPYPTNDELRAEAQEQKPEVYFLVYDESGAPIRRVNGGTDSGFQRVAWDLRYAAPKVHEHSEDGEED